MSVLKILKSEKLSLNIEFLDNSGILTRRSQPITFMSNDSSDQEKFDMCKAVGKILISNPKSVQETYVYELMEG